MHTHALANACMHSCALLQQCTVAISPPLASSLLCNCYWKCSTAMGASSWRIYLTQVHNSVHVHKHTHILGGTRVDQPAKTGSNVSHLMSTPLTSHNTLQAYTHTLTHTLMHISEMLSFVWLLLYHQEPHHSAAWITSSDSDFWLWRLSMTKMSLILS